MQNEDKIDQESGRGTDTKIAHVTLGEIVLPLPVVANEELRPLLEKAFADAGVNINQYTVGHEANSINPETEYPEFGFFKKAFNLLGKAGIKLNDGLKGFTDSAQSNAVLAGNYLLPGSSLVTSNLVSKGAQKNLNSGFGKIANTLSGLAGAGVGSSFTGIPSASAIGAGYSGALDSLGLGDIYKSASGALSDAAGGISDKIGQAYNGSVLQDGFKSGGDVLKSFGLNTSPDALTSGVGANAGGGESSYSAAEQSLLNNAKSVLDNPSGVKQVASSSDYASPIASALLGSYTNNKVEKQLLAQQAANKALYAPYQNFEFNPGDLTQDPGYKFNLAQGNQALDRQQLAKGGYFSGAALKEAQDYGQGLADNTYNTAFNRALTTNQEGLRGAGAVAGVNDNIGNIKAGSTVNSGNLYSGALGSILGGNSFTNSGALQGGTSGDYLSKLLRQLALQRQGAFA